MLPILKWIPRASPSNRLHLIGKEIQVMVLDSYLTLKWKQIGAYKYLIDNFDFDFLYETNTSSYIRISKLIDKVEELPDSNLYAGSTPWESANFISGANRLTSRDLIERVVANRHLWDISVLEDVAFGKLVKRLGAKVIPLKSCEVPTLEALNEIDSSELMSHYHFRAKSGTPENRHDVQIMNALHSKLTQEHFE